MGERQDLRVVRTTSFIEAALLVGNGCPIVAQELNNVDRVEFAICVPKEKETMASQVQELCASPDVGPALFRIREMAFAMTNRNPRKDGNRQ